MTRSTGPDLTALGSDFSPGAEALVWNPAVHEAEGTALQFWRMSFGSRFDGDKIYDAIRSVFKERGVHAYIGYITLGQFDLLLRAWVPHSTRTYDLQLAFEDALVQQGLFRLEFMEVEHAEHWLHPLQGSKVPFPTPSPDLARAVDQFNEQQISRNLVAVPEAIKPLLADPSTALPILKLMPLDVRGVRFYSHFDHPHVAFSHTERKLLFESVLKECRAVLDEWSPIARERGVAEPHLSVYEGTGTFSSVIVLAKAPYGAFHAFMREIIFRLRSLTWNITHTVRPHTHVIADEQFAMFSEGLAIGRRVRQSLDPDAILTATESGSLEFKATFATDLKAFIFAGRRKSLESCKNAVAKAVCAMLNSDDGGTVVIGLVELEKELSSARSGKPSEVPARLDRLAEACGVSVERLEELPSEGILNVVIGNSFEWEEGEPYDAEDSWNRSLDGALNTRISPAPGPWLRRETVVLADGRQLTAIHCDPPKSEWFYASPPGEEEGQFLVREHGATLRYRGTNADNYRRAHPRGFSGEGRFG